MVDVFLLSDAEFLQKVGFLGGGVHLEAHAVAELDVFRDGAQAAAVVPREESVPNLHGQSSPLYFKAMKMTTSATKTMRRATRMNSASSFGITRFYPSLGARAS